MKNTQHFQLRRGRNGAWRFVLVAGNNEIITTSENSCGHADPTRRGRARSVVVVHRHACLWAPGRHAARDGREGSCAVTASKLETRLGSGAGCGGQRYLNDLKKGVG